MPVATHRVGLFVVAVASAALAGLPLQLQAGVHAASNCNDSGPGSLRNAIAMAVDGDVVDLSGLACGRISLSSGELEIPQRSLTLRGRSRDALIVDAGADSRVLRHSGDGVMTLDHLTIANGRVEAEGVASGGCVASAGSVVLNCARVDGCVVHATPDPVEGQVVTSGAGVHAQGDVHLTHSIVSNNVGNGIGFGGGVRSGVGTVTLYRSLITGNQSSQGGGIYARNVTATYSTIRANRAVYGGGIFAGERALINKTTLSRNVATGVVEGEESEVPGGGAIYSFVSVDVLDSTISGNSAVRNAGIRTNFAALSNSTVAFNRDEAVAPQGGQCAGTIFANRLRLDSVIVARNVCGNGPDWDIAAGVEIEGSKNLIERSQSPIPVDTIALDPRLAPLAQNGGPTSTHLLLDGSPAIDQGSNVKSRQYDQRGPGFSRTRGLTTDIGATER